MTAYRSANPQSPRWNFKRVLAVILGCLLVNGALFALLYRHWKFQEVLATLDSGGDFDFFIRHAEELGVSRDARSPAWVLIEETRAAIAAAGGVPGTVLSAEAKRSWDTANPCSARSPLYRLWSREKEFQHVSGAPSTTEPSVLLFALFEEYSNLHRTCTHGGDINYVTEQYRSGNESSPCKFLVVEFGTYGIGNRLLWMVSAFQYALLTKRVLLIDTRSTVHSMLCQPFSGSSWLLPDTFPYSSDQRWPMPSYFQEVWDDWEDKEGAATRKKAAEEKEDVVQNGLKSLQMEDIVREKRETMAMILSKIQDEMDRELLDKEKSAKSGHSSRRLRGTEEPPNFFQVQGNDGWAPNPRFFCRSEQERLHRVKWISLSSGCLYFLPDLFAVSSYRPALEELYPDRDPLTHLLRYLTVPVNSIWKKVRSVYTAEFLTASKVVGMQVRYREGPGMYKNLNNIVNPRFSRCARHNDLIPDPAAPQSMTTRSALKNQEAPVVIFVASLFPGLRDHLERFYEQTMKGHDSRPVKLLQLSEYRFQSYEVDADHQAFTEILCLSLSDEILTSPQSTYGQMAQAYGGLTPWLIDFSPQATRDCVRGQSSDGCYQLPITKFTCPFDRDVDGMAMTDAVYYLKPCQDTDGLQLVPPWSPSLKV